MKKAGNAVRRALLCAAGNVSLYVTVTFFVTSLLILGPQFWWREYVNMFERYALIPWGMSLCLLRLARREGQKDAAQRIDLSVLFVLLVWIVVPFAIRFGNTFNNSASWYNHTVLFFGIYATIVETQESQRERLFDLAGVLFALASVLLGAALLYCAVTVQKFGDYEYAFGIVDGIYLSAFTHYNITGMVALCCQMMSLTALCRQKNKAMRALSFVSVVMMALVVVLTQSRTARYVMILSFAAGAYGLLSADARLGRTLIRHGVGLLAAAVVAFAGYAAVDMISDAAIAHYNQTSRMAQTTFVRSAAAETVSAAQTNEGLETERREGDQKQLKGRVPPDASFSGRTAIWRNLFSRWRDYPKYLLIGHGITRIGSLVTENTIHEGRDAVSIHNAYLQYTADYGLIGFVLLCIFFAVILKPVLRVFFARGEAQIPGYRALCMLVIACLMTGMMESAPLGAMSPMNMMLFYALALLEARGCDIKPCKA